MSSRHSVFVIVIFCGLLFAGVMLAGPLDPPSGSIQETDQLRTKADARIPLNTGVTGNFANSFVINEPGSYYLTSDVSVSSARDGIRIEASFVTLDLNGFNINGVGNAPFRGERGFGGPGASTAIVAASGLRSVTVRNGSFDNHSGDAINLGGVTGAVVEDVRIDDARGAVLVGNTSRVSRVTVTRSDSGIQAGENCVVEDCVVDGPSGTAFSGAGVFRRCTAANASIGFDVQGRVVDCNVRDNATDGFRLGTASSASGCVAEANDIGFIVVGASVVGVRIEGCVAVNNAGEGFRFAGVGGLLVGSIAANNAVNFDTGSGGNAIGEIITLTTANDRVLDRDDAGQANFAFTAP